MRSSDLYSVCCVLFPRKKRAYVFIPAPFIQVIHKNQAACTPLKGLPIIYFFTYSVLPIILVCTVCSHLCKPFGLYYKRTILRNIFLKQYTTDLHFPQNDSNWILTRPVPQSVPLSGQTYANPWLNLVQESDKCNEMQA